MTTFATGFVQNKFDILAPVDQESNTTHEPDDLLGDLRNNSRGPRVCIIRFKKFTMSGRTKEGLDNDRKKKKETKDKKREEQPTTRINWRGERRSKKQRKPSKSNRIKRKKFVQTQKIKVDSMYHEYQLVIILFRKVQNFESGMLPSFCHCFTGFRTVFVCALGPFLLMLVIFSHSSRFGHFKRKNGTKKSN